MTAITTICRAAWRPAAALTLLTLVLTGCNSTPDKAADARNTNRSIDQVQNPADSATIK